MKKKAFIVEYRPSYCNVRLRKSFEGAIDESVYTTELACYRLRGNKEYKFGDIIPRLPVSNIPGSNASSKEESYMGIIEATDSADALRRFMSKLRLSKMMKKIK